MNSYNFLIDYYTNELNSAQFYQRISESFINSMKIKIYLNIENQLFKVHKNPSELKKLQISNLIGNSFVMQSVKMTTRVLSVVRISS